MNNRNITIKPISFGERYYIEMINNSKNKIAIFIPLVITVVFLYFSFYEYPRIAMFNVFMSIICLILSVISAERHLGYKIIKRQQEIIENNINNDHA